MVRIGHFSTFQINPWHAPKAPLFKSISLPNPLFLHPFPHILSLLSAPPLSKLSLTSYILGSWKTSNFRGRSPKSATFGEGPFSGVLDHGRFPFNSGISTPIWGTVRTLISHSVNIPTSGKPLLRYQGALVGILLCDFGRPKRRNESPIRELTHPLDGSGDFIC